MPQSLGKPVAQVLNGEILVYLHLNPYGVDPHNRVTMSCNDEKTFRRSRDFLIEQRAQYYRSLAAPCESGKTVFVGGEKCRLAVIGEQPG